MVPHPRGEPPSIAAAFHECMLGLMDHKAEDFDDVSRPWFKTIQSTMNTDDEPAYWCDRESPL